MHSLFVPTLLAGLLASISTASAIPTRTQERSLFSRDATYNITELTCTPAEIGSSQAQFLPLSPGGCVNSFINFTRTHSAAAAATTSSAANSTPSGDITFTTNVTLAKAQPFNYSATPIEIAPEAEENTPSGVCGLAFAVYYGAATKKPNVQVSLAALQYATNAIINKCVGSNGPGNGGSVVLTTDSGYQIDVTVEQPV